MILRETADHFILYKQHDHGLLSGEMGANWGNGVFGPLPFRMTFAAAIHDISWIDEDENISWNSDDNKPYDFVDLPLKRRLDMYAKGLDHTEKLDPYSAVLVSKHYSSFYSEEDGEEVKTFLQNERIRRTELAETASISSSEQTDDLKILRMLDNLSLYVCLNGPGTPKTEVHPWYQDGLMAYTADGGEQRLSLEWTNQHTITIDPFPFQAEWTASIPVYRIHKSQKGDNLDKMKEQSLQLVTFAPVSARP
ncbi:DUF3891 family protein [Bacillus marinisedimentorum]|uniref:DUF3891 family protein n=1 Tax=Bacillus marinisedimentorum TaxID=1821260 RepID=UPI0008729583|nr:DUF3891 family protein [Bacillus marinisedimentorum]